MLIDWLKSLRSHHPRRRNTHRLATPAPLEPRTLLSSAPIGPEFRVNSFTTSNQAAPSIGMDADGDYVVTWMSYGQDGYGYGVYAQRYNAAGVAQGSEFRVNSYTTDLQRTPSIGMDADGDFVVTWTSNGQDGSSQGVYAQRYNAAGVAQGTEFQVNSFTTNPQLNPSIGMDANGDFVIAWQSNGQDGSLDGIYAQRYDAAGVAQGSEFRVNSFTTGDQRNPSIGMDADGDFVITWQSGTFSGSGQDGSGYGIYAQRYNAAGVAQGSEFQVNSFTTNSQLNPSIGMDADGDFVVTWTSIGQDGSNYGIYAQRYDAAGVAQGFEFRVNSYTSDIQSDPSIAMDADGDFVITWRSGAFPGSGQDGSLDGIYGQRYNAAGVAQGTEFRGNSYTTSNQQFPSIGMDADGDFVISWQSTGQDGSSNGIYAQRFRAGKPNYLGVWRAGQFYLDSNQSDDWSGSIDDTLNYFGSTTDKPLVGDWNGDGYSDIGVWRNGTFYLDANGNGIWDGPATDRQFIFGNTTDTPLVGDWNGDGYDEIGVWRAGQFYLDLDGSRSWDGTIDGLYFFGALTDTPLIGDWNGDGTDDIGVWRAGTFYLDLNGNHVWNPGVDGSYIFGTPTDTPVVGKFNDDVVDDIGVWRAGVFYLDNNSNHKWDGSRVDSLVAFGSTTDTPLIGNWRPKSIPGTPPAPALPPTSLTVNTSTDTTLLPPTSNPPDEATLASLLALPTKKQNR